MIRLLWALCLSKVVYLGHGYGILDPNSRVALVRKPYYLNKLAGIELKFVKEAQSTMKSLLPEEGKRLLTRYLNEFNRANKDLRGFNLSQDLELNVQAITLNPIAVYHMARRFQFELGFIAKYFLKENLPFSHLLQSNEWFTWEDVNSVKQDIFVICDMYELKIKDVANGIFLNVETGTSLNALDCLHFGYVAKDNSYYSMAIEFLEEALQRALMDQSTKIEEIELMLNATIKEHDKKLKDAMKDENSRFFNRKIGPLRKRNPETYKTLRFRNRHTHDDGVHDLCMFGSSLEENQKKKLFCWYETEIDPYWRINPLKIEAISLAPELFRIYDLLTEKQIELFKEISTNHSRDNDTNIYDSLPSETVLINEMEYPGLQTIPLSAEKLTGLRVVRPEDSRPNRLVSYTSGSVFPPHTDTLIKHPDGRTEVCSATLLYYIEEPELGGNTVFVTPGISVEPIKGSALLYYNLRSEEQAEFNNLHSGCPVVLGRKRVSAKLIYHTEQFQTLKCLRDKKKPYGYWLNSKFYQRRRRQLLK